MSRSTVKPLVVALDLEMNQPSRKIIQIGAVIGDVRTGEIVSRFDTKVDPGEPLAERIADLTGIHPEQLTGAPRLKAAGEALARWLAPYDDRRLLNPLTWGGGDSVELREQLGRKDECWLFGRRWIDVKTIYGAWRMAQGRNIEGGLARAMTKLGLSFEGRKHDAVDDALNTFRMYRALLAEFSKAGALQKA